MRRIALPLLALALPLSLIGCGDDDDDAPLPTPTASSLPTPAPTTTPSPTPTTSAVTRTVVATLDEPWAMTALPDGRLLVTEKAGRLRLVTTAGQAGTVANTPTVASAGQGGLLDVAVDPQYAAFPYIYLSFAEPGTGGGAGLAVARARLTANGAALTDVEVIWRQAPKIGNDDRHFGGRIAFGPDNRLYVTAGERHQGAPAQDLSTTLGKIIRINRDGSVPTDNPFVATANARPEIWTYGHRNPYGLVFSGDGRLFESEMGPEGGDEFNLITRGANYGWRLVSEGNDGGEVLPRHSTNPAFAAPLVSWTPVISPSGMIQYTGNLFNGWNGDFVLGALSGQALVRVRVSGTTAAEVGRIALGVRVREVEQAPDGAIWILEDGAGGRLVRLNPA